MTDYKQGLVKDIDDAECHRDLYNILKNVALPQLKLFLKQQISDKNSNDLRELYWKSKCILDLFGDDITRECLSYLDIYQLHKLKIVSQSFQKKYKICIRSRHHLSKHCKIW